MANDKKTKTTAPPPPKKAKTILRTVEKELPCVLTDKELLSKGDEAAKLDHKLSELRLRKKTTNEEIGGDIKGTEGAIRTIHQQIRSRSETRTVLCDEVADYGNGIVRMVRKDSGKVVETRALLSHERQPALPGLLGLEGGKSDKPEKASKKSKAGKKSEPVAEAPAGA